VQASAMAAMAAGGIVIVGVSAEEEVACDTRGLTA